jgi:hypothetical protein
MKNLTALPKSRLVEMVVQWLEVGVRLLLDHNTGGGAVRLWCAAVGFSAERPIVYRCTRIVDQMYRHFQMRKIRLLAISS